jgi:hypothetical protein
VLFFLTSPAGPAYGGSATKYNLWRQQEKSFEDVTAYEYNSAQFSMTGAVFPEQIFGIRVSHDYFHLFGVPFAAGRAFTTDEDRPGGGHVAVVSYGLWQRHFGGDSKIAGKTLSLSGTPYAIVGVVGPGFNTELSVPPDVWLPFQIAPDSADNAQYFNVVGRLKRGVSVDVANAQLERATEDFRSTLPAPMLQICCWLA